MLQSPWILFCELHTAVWRQTPKYCTLIITHNAIEHVRVCKIFGLVLVFCSIVGCRDSLIRVWKVITGKTFTHLFVNKWLLSLDHQPVAYNEQHWIFNNVYLSDILNCLTGKKKFEFKGPVEDRCVVICIKFLNSFSFQ